jgi:hypothetical protein
VQYSYKGFVIVLIGARQVGKTTLTKILATQLQKKWAYYNCDEIDVKRNLEQANTTNLANLFGDNELIIIDEAQRVENIGIVAKLVVDNFSDKQLILTGSSALEIANTIYEPLTGRHITFNLYPFSYKELYDKTTSLEMNRQLPWHLIYGCYPKVVLHKTTAALQLKNLANDYLYKDVLAWKDIRKPDLLNKLVHLLALQMCNELSLHELAIKLKVNTVTVENYIDLLEKSYVVYRLPAYSTNERKEVVKMKKIYFWDNGIRNAVLGNFSNIENRTDIGALWENFVITERLKMNHYLAKGAKPFFWRSKQQQEIDYVEYTLNSLQGFECKWSATAKGKPTKAFTNLYPQASATIIHNENYADFIMQ